MEKQSAGIIMYSTIDRKLRVLLVHPGGPFWARKDAGAWSIPKGEIEAGEEPLTAAKREFYEELGAKVPDGDFKALGSTKLKSGKVIYAWGITGSFDPKKIRCNTFEMEWPPKSGKIGTFPEVDMAAWFSFDEACIKINKGQIPLLDKLKDHLDLPGQSQTSLF